MLSWWHEEQSCASIPLSRASVKWQDAVWADEAAGWSWRRVLLWTPLVLACPGRRLIHLPAPRKLTWAKRKHFIAGSVMWTVVMCGQSQCEMGLRTGSLAKWGKEPGWAGWSLWGCASQPDPLGKTRPSLSHFPCKAEAIGRWFSCWVWVCFPFISKRSQCISARKFKVASHELVWNEI